MWFRSQIWLNLPKMGWWLIAIIFFHLVLPPMPVRHCGYIIAKKHWYEVKTSAAADADHASSVPRAAELKHLGGLLPFERFLHAIRVPCRSQ
jgi:hypothetical protein